MPAFMYILLLFPVTQNLQTALFMYPLSSLGLGQKLTLVPFFVLLFTETESIYICAVLKLYLPTQKFK
jgi:hypothetical protein